ncbi:MAG: gamma-glutamyltransferase, partial [Candidatus Tectomicrobia bacterium]|nr:gamma-glutamyltransferase [Candidatus Tectomicrobia bacterium]
GPVFLQQLTILEGFDLYSLGHNSVDYIHTVVESLKLAFADREQYYGDPDFVDVPLKGLFSKEYASERRKLIDSQRASLKQRPGNPYPYEGRPGKAPGVQSSEVRPWLGGTTQTVTMDKGGNMFAATPSGGWMSSPVIKGLGFPFTSRGQAFWLRPESPTALAPGKRPRVTLSPSLVLKDGKPSILFNTPGGDAQDQWTLQMFLNAIDFGMNPQQAIDAPRFRSAHFHSSFYPRKAEPGVLMMESRFSPEVIKALEARGHKISTTGDWSQGRLGAIRVNPRTGVLEAGSDPRGRQAYAIAW